MGEKVGGTQLNKHQINSIFSLLCIRLWPAASIPAVVCLSYGQHPSSLLSCVCLMASTLHPCCHMSVLWPAPFIPAVACLSYGLDPSSLLLSVLWPESLLSSACLMAQVRHLCCCLFVLWPGVFNPALVCLMASTLHPRWHLPALGPASFISDNYRLSCGLNPHPPTHPKCQSAVLSSIPNPWCCLSRVCNHHPHPSSTHNDVLRLQP